MATLISSPYPENDLIFFETIVENVIGEMWGKMDKALLDRFIHQLEWTELACGERLYKQGEIGDCMHILISGRLKVLLQTETDRITLGEVSAGECVGEMSLLSEQPRNADIYAIRNSVLVRITKDEFTDLCKTQPQLLLRMSKMVIERLTNKDRLRKTPARVKNIAFLPMSDGINMNSFIQKMQTILAKSGRVLLLNEQNINAHLEQTELSDYSENRSDNLIFGRWLDKIEQEYDYILYQGNFQDDYWTHSCIRQADKIMLVKNFYDFGKTSIEKELLDDAKKLSYVQKSLVLLHPNGRKAPVDTARHLEMRDIDMHHHIRLDNDSDFERLSRFMRGKAVGLVLGGGGAKGFAHIGIIQAMRENNIPIDYVGGTSMGGLIAACVAMDMNTKELYTQGKVAFVDDKPLKDVTIPVVSYYAGRRLEKILQKNLGMNNIEDQWLNFFCISSNLTKAGMLVHRRGSFWKAIRASISIPGAFPPVVNGNDLLVDGGLMNNLPIDVMSEMGVGKIIAVDLNAEKEYQLNYEEIPGAIQLLKNKFVSKKKRLKVPSLMTIISKSIVLASYEKSNAQKSMADWFMNPPVGKFGILDFKRFDEVASIGYDYAHAQLEARPDFLEYFG